MQIRFSIDGDNGVAKIFLWKILKNAVTRLNFSTRSKNIKTAACELVAESEQPMGRQLMTDIIPKVPLALGKPISPSSKAFESLLKIVFHLVFYEALPNQAPALLPGSLIAKVRA